MAKVRAVTAMAFIASVEVKVLLSPAYTPAT
jgi:hypothetical protein